MRAYMKGHVSALVAQADMFGHSGNLRRLFLALPRHLLSKGLHSLGGSAERRRIVRQEIWGWWLGLGYLLNPTWRRRRPATPLSLDTRLPPASPTVSRQA